MSLELYLLSILDNARIFLMVLGGLFILTAFFYWEKFQRLLCNERESLNKNLLASFLIAAFLSFFICGFTPTKKSLIESYLIIEGQKIITSENADKFFQKLDEKSDEIINRIK